MFDNLFRQGLGKERGVDTTQRIATDICFLDEINKRYKNGEAEGARYIIDHRIISDYNYWMRHKNNAAIDNENYKAALSEVSDLAGIEYDDVLKELLSTQRSTVALDCKNSNEAGKLGVNLASHLFDGSLGGIWYADHFGFINNWYGDDIFFHYFNDRVHDLKNIIQTKILEAKEVTAKKIELEIAAEERKQAEETKRRLWLQTAEGKNYVAEMAAREKRAEEDRIRVEKVETMRIAKIASEESARKEKIRIQCEGMKSWASDSRELIGAALRVSAASVSLLRFRMGTVFCLAIVDTPKGPEKCAVDSILQDKKTGAYYASLGGIAAIQAACGSWAF